MPDLRTRFRPADRIAAPDLWPDVLTREPGEPPPRSPWGRVTTLAVAMGVAALAILVLIRVLPLGGAKPVAPSPTAPRPAPSSSASPATLPSAGEVTETIAFQGSLLVAADGKIYAVRAVSDTAYTMLRIDADGSRTSSRIKDDLSNYLGRSAATADAVYLGTDVIHRFINSKDELIRIDAKSLRVTARIALDDNVYGLVADRRNVWVSTANRILRPDPSTLALRSTIVVPGLDPVPTGSDDISLTLGSGGLWAVAGNAARATLYRLDPQSLSVLAKAKVPGLPGQGFFATATDQAVWMVYDSGIRKVDPQRASIGDLIPIQELTTAVARGNGLVAVLGQASIAQIDGDGRMVALTRDIGEVGGFVAVDGRDVWTTGNSGILHFVLADVPAGS